VSCELDFAASESRVIVAGYGASRSTAAALGMSVFSRDLTSCTWILYHDSGQLRTNLTSSDGVCTIFTFRERTSFLDMDAEIQPCS
jgi:hypothetical protein